jgi:hypothetical protein
MVVGASEPQPASTAAAVIISPAATRGANEAN